MSDFEHVTIEAAVETYETATGIFEALLREVRELSKKKPDATLSASKVRIVNNVLNDLLAILKEEPEGKYLEPLADESLPQVSDALMMMAQFNAALDAFKDRYFQRVERRFGKSGRYWVTQEQVEFWEEEDAEIQARYGREDDDFQ